MNGTLTKLLTNYPLPSRAIIRTSMQYKDADVLQTLIAHAIANPKGQFAFQKIFEQAIIYSKTRFFLSQWQHKLPADVVLATWIMLVRRMHNCPNTFFFRSQVTQVFLQRVIHSKDFAESPVPLDSLMDVCLQSRNINVVGPAIRYILSLKYQPTEIQLKTLQTLGFGFHDIIACSPTP